MNEVFVEFDDPKKMSKIHEKDTAKAINGKIQAGSGSSWSEKGDVRSKYLLGECKVSRRYQYPLNAVTWLKIEKEAAAANLRIPFMRVTIRNGDFAVISKMTYDLNGFDGKHIQHDIKTARRSVNIVETQKHTHVSFGDVTAIATVPWDYFLEKAKELGWIE